LVARRVRREHRAIVPRAHSAPYNLAFRSGRVTQTGRGREGWDAGEVN